MRSPLAEKMNTFAASVVALVFLVSGVSHALPSTLASFPKVSGTIKEIAKGGLCTAVRIKLDDGTERKVARQIHSALKRKTYYPFKSYREPGRDEALLLFTGKELAPFKVGDSIVVLGYMIIADLEASPRGWPICAKIEKQ